MPFDPFINEHLGHFAGLNNAGSGVESCPHSSAQRLEQGKLPVADDPSSEAYSRDRIRVESTMRMDRQPSPEDKGPQLAEQRWLDVERRFTRHFALAALFLAAALVTTYVAANVGQLALARASCVAIFCGMARVIHLIIERRRTYIAVKTEGGMTREEALSEFNSRFGG
jgi:hypothetical protein